MLVTGAVAAALVNLTSVGLELLGNRDAYANLAPRAMDRPYR